DADELLEADLDARLLERFADRGHLDLLAAVDVPGRKGPQAEAGLDPSSYEADPPLDLGNHAGGELGIVVVDEPARGARRKGGLAGCFLLARERAGAPGAELQSVVGWIVRIVESCGVVKGRHGVFSGRGGVRRILRSRRARGRSWLGPPCGRAPHRV